MYVGSSCVRLVPWPPFPNGLVVVVEMTITCLFEGAASVVFDKIRMRMERQCFKLTHVHSPPLIATNSKQRQRCGFGQPMKAVVDTSLSYYLSLWLSQPHVLDIPFSCY